MKKVIKNELISLFNSIKCLKKGKLTFLSFIKLITFSLYNLLSRVKITYSSNILKSVDEKDMKDKILVAYCNLFANTKFIPSKEIHSAFDIKNYCSILGLQLSRYQFVSSDALLKSRNFHETERFVYENIVACFKRLNNIDPIIFINYVKNKYIEDGMGNISYKNNHVVCPDYYKKINSGVLLTYSLGGCVAIIICNSRDLYLGHFRWNGAGTIRNDKIFYELINLIDNECTLFIISDEPFNVLEDIKKILEDSCEDLKVYIHKKNESLIYSLKIIHKVNNPEIKYIPSLKNIRNKVGWRDPVCTIPFGDFIELDFKKINYEY